MFTMRGVFGIETELDTIREDGTMSPWEEQQVSRCRDCGLVEGTERRLAWLTL